MRKCPSARLILRSEELDDSTGRELLDEYAYCVLGSGGEKVFYAERYGGLGIFSNGGGVRCGLHGRYQVKGIGINPLKGRRTPAAYSSGSMDLTEAVREFVWSRILNASLPHGSPEVRAVVDLGECSGDPEGRPQRRYASIRESTLRVAHFERSQHFKPHAKHGMAHDSLRVMAALEVLASGNLHCAVNASDPGFRQGVLAALTSIAVRHAEQLASAKARRIMHGALSGSNACLDGGWIDFGSTAQLPGFATTSNFTLGFWREYEYLFDSVKNICHSAELYSYGRFAGEKAFQSFVDAFARTYEENLAKQFCYLIGLDEPFVQTAHPNVIGILVRIARRLVAAARLGDRSVPSDPDCLRDHPSTKALEMARLCGIALARHGDEAGSAQPEIPDDRLMSDIRELAVAYRLYATHNGVPVEYAYLAILISCLRRCSHLDSLDPRRMNKVIPMYEGSEEALNAYVQEVTLDAAVAFNTRTGWRTEVGRRGTDLYYYDPIENVIRSRDGNGIPLQDWLKSDMPEASRSIAEALTVCMERIDA